MGLHAGEECAITLRREAFDLCTEANLLPATALQDPEDAASSVPAGRRNVSVKTHQRVHFPYPYCNGREG